ncbi:CHAT domain-containing protein [Xylaria telfairii]|nr:CHAT domain-containing protein [Xylaria telfairii]
MTFLHTLHQPSVTHDEKSAKHDNIDDTIIYLQQQVDLNAHDIRLEQLADLVNKLAGQYAKTGLPADIHQAIHHAEKAVATVSITNPDHASWLSNLGNLLAWRYERTGEICYLQAAILRAEEALDATPCDHPNQPGRLSNLGNRLGRRYELTGAMEDLESAIFQCTRALKLTPLVHPCRASRLNSLGSWMARKYERTGNFSDLEEAILRATEALAITPWRHPDRALYLNSLGTILARKYSHKLDPVDISRAVSFVKEALRLTPADSPERINWLSNLATIVAWKFQYKRFPKDLDHAIHLAYETLEAMPAGHQYQALALLSHGDLLCCRYNQPNAPEDQRRRDYDDSMSYYKKAWDSHNSPPAVRIRAAQKVARILLQHGKCKESNDLLYSAVQLIPSISPHNLKQQDRQYIFGEFAGLATLAASASLAAGKEPVHALQLLEQGRAVGTGQRLGIRAALTALKLQQPELAEKLERIHIFLKSSTLFDCQARIAERNDEPTQRPEANRRYRAAAQINIVATEIRKLPGFETFLLSPTRKELQAAASGGPVVVINASPFCCDAILIRTCSIQSMPLSRLNYKVLREMVDLFKTAREMNRPFHDQKDMSQILEWLWDEVTSPILNELGFREPPREGDVWPHVWWIPTGLLSTLPLHAAGRHKSTLLETVIDRVVSSYSSSVRALLCMQRQPVRFGRFRGEACLVSMAGTPGCSSLPTAAEEIASVEALLPALGVETTRTLRNTRKAEVINSLKSCDIFHFAGHAVANQEDPSQSSLLLDDWKESPFTVESIMNSNLHGNKPFLAYLSACSTGAISNEFLLDESINIMTACQLAGFRHAVGSLWNLFNRYPAIAAARFYKVLGDCGVLDDNAVAWAVHATARYIREITRGREDATRGAGDPFAWAAYIHIGP